MTSVNLDEYVGLPEGNPQSYHQFMKDNLFNKKPFKHSYVPDGNAADIEQAAKDYDQIIADNPIDIQILGIGRNGHIGFNEPGSSFDSTTHKVHLTESTIEANKRFFDDEKDVPRYAISMGIGSIMKGKQIILMLTAKIRPTPSSHDRGPCDRPRAGFGPAKPQRRHHHY